jgi:hypothetical protein
VTVRTRATISFKRAQRPTTTTLASGDRFPVPFEDFLCKQSGGLKVIGEKVNKAAILAKNLPFLPAELLRKFD